MFIYHCARLIHVYITFLESGAITVVDDDGPRSCCFQKTLLLVEVVVSSTILSQAVPKRIRILLCRAPVTYHYFRYVPEFVAQRRGISFGYERSPPSLIVFASGSDRAANQLHFPAVRHEDSEMERFEGGGSVLKIQYTIRTFGDNSSAGEIFCKGYC